MSLSITIVTPMPGAVLTPNFTASGSFSTFLMERGKDRVLDWNLRMRLAYTISVNVTKGSQTWGPFAGVPNGTNWQASVSGIPAGTGYTVTATISDGTDMASHAIETVDVQDAPGIQILQITPPPTPYLDERDKFDLDGKFVDATADYMFAFPYTIRTTMSTTDIPATGGKHYKVTYNFGNAVDLEGKDGEPLDKPNKKWKLKKIKVLEGQIVMVFLKKGSSYIARNVSQLF